jgi:hypothetical protein
LKAHTSGPTAERLLANLAVGRADSLFAADIDHERYNLAVRIAAFSAPLRGAFCSGWWAVPGASGRVAGLVQGLVRSAAARVMGASPDLATGANANWSRPGTGLDS